MQLLLDINNINILLGSVLLALSAVMFMIPIPAIERWHNFRVGRNTLSIAYILLGGLMIVNGILGSDGGTALSGMVTLVVAFFQAILYTKICNLFLKPRTFDGIPYSLLLTLFALFGIGMAISYAVAPKAFIGIFYVGLGLYALLLIYCSVAFIRNYNKTLKHLEYIYDEDMQYRLRWVKGCFYSALLIGVMAWFMALFHTSEPLNILCMFVYTIYYLCMVGYFMRYVNNYNFILKSDEWSPVNEPIAISPTLESLEKEKSRPAKEDKQLTERLKRWVEQKKYRNCSKTIDDILCELDTTRPKLNEYMNHHYGMNFRAWRNTLRIEEAKRMLIETNIPVANIHNAVGYTDRSNFHRHFAEIAGLTPAQYRSKHKGGR